MNIDGTTIVLIMLSVILGVAYFSIRNRRKQRERQMATRRRAL
jgi:hypothetical protein